MAIGLFLVESHAVREFEHDSGQGAAPPGASRCCARTSVRAPSRPVPLRRAEPLCGRGFARHAPAVPFFYRGDLLTPTIVFVHASRTTAELVAGGRGGKERAARYERSSDWPRGAQPPAPDQVQIPEPYGSPAPNHFMSIEP